MRVLGYIENTPYKVTVFKMNRKFTVKFETGLYEMAFKLYEGDNMKSLEDVKKFVDGDLVNTVRRKFHDMHQAALKSFSKLKPEVVEEEFEAII